MIINCWILFAWTLIKLVMFVRNLYSKFLVVSIFSRQFDDYLLATQKLKQKNYVHKIQIIQ